MTFGQMIRRLLGPMADPVARIYRSYYIDLESWATTLHRLQRADSILEIGCGDGHLCGFLASVFDQAHVLGIDVADDPGRLHEGPDDRVSFRQTTAEDLARSGAGYDLVVLSDVLHHVPGDGRASLLQAAWAMTLPGGALAVKDWRKSRSLANLAAYASDRFVSGDTPEFFEDAGDMIDLVVAACPGGSIAEQGWVPPRVNNCYVVVNRAVDA